MKKRILFLIHDLGPRGAEKVLVNLVNGLDKSLFDVSVKTLFNWGPNIGFLSPEVKYSYWMPMDIRGNSHWMKLWSPEKLYRTIVRDQYDIVVSFLEGPCARVAGGCPADGTKVIEWIHTPIMDEAKFTEGFRSRNEAEQCYGRADTLVFVSRDVKEAFQKWFAPAKECRVLYNIFDSRGIREMALQDPAAPPMDPEKMNWCGIGRLVPQKGWSRMLYIQKRLLAEGFHAHLFVIGDGPQREELAGLANCLGISDSVTFTGYQTNPYQYLARCMLFACASEREGLSTAVVESLLLGTPVCTVNVGGMKEILGKNDEFGIVTENDDEALYTAVRRFFGEPDHRLLYAKLAAERGKFFDQKAAIRNAEELFLSV